MIDILLATYNGAAYLSEQLDSLKNQTHADWRILARDDGSTDSTKEILRAFARANPGHLKIIEDTERGLGAKGNFARLLEQANAPYVMFCDQDDFWLPHKIELTLSWMQMAEAKYGAQTPLLIHTDLEVVDRNLQCMDASFWRYQHLDPRTSQSWSRLLMQNVVTGCTMMINRPLLKLASPIPPEAIMHDWWLALVAALFGRIESIPQATVLYRQHGSNDTGAKSWNLGYVLQKARSFYDREALVKSIKDVLRQAKSLQRYSPHLDPERQKVIGAFANLETMGFLERRIFLLRHQILKIGLIRNTGLLFRV